MSLINVVQYNILAPKLCTEKHFPKCASDSLKKEVRWNRLLIKLREETTRNSIICLQEVSQEWCGKLTVFFENYGYSFITRLYGNQYSGYMGIGTAFPRSKYSLDECHLVQVKDYIPGKQIKLDNTWTNWLTSNTSKLYNWLNYQAGYLLPTEPEDHWARAKYKWNIMIVLKLTNESSNEQFTVANYHIPCDFTRPTVMMLHSSVAMQQAQKIAGDVPLVFAADWNFKPDSECYQLITTGELPASFKMQESATSVDLAKWSPTKGLKSMNSAYMEVNGSEPLYTNYSFTEWSGDEGNFVATLDYIFLSKNNWNIMSVEPLPEDDPSLVFSTPLPSDEEPSDHIKLRVELTIK